MFVQSDLISQCRKHNQKAQLKLYRKYADGMFCVAMRFLKNTADAEDVTQEAFIRAFQKIDQFQGEVTFGAWLKRIVVNRCIDFLKARRQHFVELEEHRLTIAEEDDWTVSDEVTVERVKNCIDELPEKYRFVVQLYLVEGYDHAEISQILDINETTCRTRLMRGKGYLKELLKKENHVARS